MFPLVIPQITFALIGGFIIKFVVGFGRSNITICSAGISMFIGSLAVVYYKGQRKHCN